MRFDKLTVKAQDIFQGAQQVAEQYHHSSVDVEHLLFATLDQEGGIARPLLERLDADPDQIRRQVVENLESMAKVQGSDAYGTQLTPRMQRVLADAFKQAEKLGDEYVSTDICCWRWPATPARRAAFSRRRESTRRGFWRASKI